ncbi:hypothetical protein THAOC_37206, partial [Thalassiosira oceanica]
CAAALGDSAAEIRRSYCKGEDEALDKLNSSVKFYLMDIGLSEFLYRNQRGILRLEQWSDGLLRCSNSFRFHVPDRSPVLWFQGVAAGFLSYYDLLSMRSIISKKKVRMSLEDLRRAGARSTGDLRAAAFAASHGPSPN